MTQHHVRHDGTAFQVYRTETGIDRTDVGQPFRTPRLAGQYADLSAGKPISPLRTPVTRTGDDTTLPAAGELREGTPRRRSGSPVAVIPPASDRA